jgi:hypothetical protein
LADVPNFARPSADVSRGSWTTQSGATTNLWSTIDEATADDADFVQSALGDNTAYEVRLSSVAPAIIARLHSVTLRGRKDQSAGNTKGVTVALFQGATQIASQDFPALAATVNQEVINIPKSIASSITNYADLRLRFTPTGITSGGGSRRRVVIPQAFLQVPQATDLVDDLLTRWSITTGTSDGNVTATRSGITGRGNTLAKAVMDLYQQLREVDPENAELIQRGEIARSLWKVIEYERIRSEIVAGTYNLPAHQTQVEALAIVDQKLSNFTALAKSEDAGEPD